MRRTHDAAVTLMDASRLQDATHHFGSATLRVLLHGSSSSTVATELGVFLDDPVIKDNLKCRSTSTSC